ncbi:MAG: M23 family metallopeptidase [Epulopiscium sp.]|nr:M23 family metallopeptidase [Candidatus Epulonipiscium sp.]
MKNNKFWMYLNKKSYYGILFLCILTIIGTTSVMTKNNKKVLDKLNEENSIDLNEEFGDYDLEDVGTINAYQNDLEITEEEAEGAGVAIVEDNPTDEEQGTVTVVSNKSAQENKEEVKHSQGEEVIAKVEVPEPDEEAQETFSFSEATNILWPVSGEIVMDYSSDKLVYDKTLEEYKVHPAVCIAPSEESKVKAVAKGKVEVIKKDPETGITVVINHGNGWRTIYGQLQKDVSVQQDQIVEEGQVIGEIGSPTKYSVLLGQHVYFQVMKDGKPVNPKELLSE